MCSDRGLNLQPLVYGTMPHPTEPPDQGWSSLDVLSQFSPELRLSTKCGPSLGLAWEGDSTTAVAFSRVSRAQVSEDGSEPQSEESLVASVAFKIHLVIHFT